ncbi:DUF300-domain-containing protein [Cylindrobasidium torrendii FP15055 ss-10]|uniref:DUF300-domain-containing protein n=1 Tax=Cylindrobasidium torrendii FP15055 ss-10 TaxID=1314674 RepID=A0A0D7B1H3_9AGAR|nr:DUF300-domain-containing protein [Cylindrobasidium torrendii FP15055 ss-10]
MPTCHELDVNTGYDDWTTDEWDSLRVQWVVAGVAGALTICVTLFNAFRHCSNYVNQKEQRQILRILYLPAVFGIVSFFSFVQYRLYVYLEMITATYEAVTMAAFLILLTEMFTFAVAAQTINQALMTKEKRKVVLFKCWRYRPSKAYVMPAIRWAVLQYIIIRPILSIIGAICESKNVYCEEEGFDFHYANAYLELANIVSMIFAFYGLLTFFFLIHEDLKERKPMLKFACIKLLIIIPQLQTIVLNILVKRGTIKSTDHRTKDEVVHGYQCLLICIEAFLLSLLMLKAYPVKEYALALPKEKLPFWRAILDSVNIFDFIQTILGSLRFFVARAQGKPESHGHGHLGRQAGNDPEYHSLTRYDSPPRRFEEPV